MGLFRRYLSAEAGRCAANGIRLSVIGRRDRLPEVLVRAIEDAESRTATGRDFWLRIAVDYSGRDAILRAAQRWSGTGAAEPSRELFSHLLADAPQAGPAPDVDLLIRTGGEKRLSDFLLWECAYAELVFTDRMWPDFGAADLADAVREFQGRERRFGRVPPPPAPLPFTGSSPSDPPSPC
jgi:undecaprenyl diphosphate synthase